MPRPNLVFIMSDDHAAHAISAYGSVVNHTPNIDRLAREGARLDAVYCTNSICTPSRASILTGAYSHVNGACSIYSEFDYRVPTFTQVLHDSGYQTALYGKWHLGVKEKANPQGFDDWRIFPDQGEYVDPLMYGPDGEERIEGYATDIVTDLSVDFLSNLDRERPFALLVHHKAPHRPWVPHPRHKDLYPVGSIPEPETMWDDHASMSNVIQDMRMSLDDLTFTDVKEEVPANLQGDDKWRERSSWKYQRYMRDYLQTIQAIDDSVGTLLDWLDAEGLAENTVVVYTSDQGFFLGDHGWFDKRLMYEESIRMPMILSYPERLAPGAHEGIVTNVDFAQTLLDAAGVPAPARMQGRSLLEQVASTDETGGGFYYRYWEHDDANHRAPAHYGYRTARYKLIYYYNDGLGIPGAGTGTYPGEWELFDLDQDPHEVNNVANDPGYAEVFADMRCRLRAGQLEVDDTPHVSEPPLTIAG